MMRSTFLIVLILASAATNAQSLLIPSRRAVDRKWMRNSTFEMTWYAVKDTLKFQIGRVNTQVSMNKKNLTVVTQVSMQNMKTPWVDTTVADVETLEPVRHSSYNPQREMVLEFGKVVTGYYVDKMKNTTLVIRDTTNDAYFDSNLYPLLIGWLPLSDHYAQDISIYDYNPAVRMGVIKAFVKNVSGGTCHTDKNGVRDVWVVTVSDEIGKNSQSTYYFDKADRRLWKQEINVNGRTMLMKLVE